MDNQHELEYEAKKKRRKQVTMAIISIIAVTLGLFLIFSPKESKKTVKIEKPKITQKEDVIKKVDKQSYGIGGGYVFEIAEYDADKKNTTGNTITIIPPTEKQDEETSEDAQAYKDSFNDPSRINLGQQMLYVKEPERVTKEVYKSERPGADLVVIFLYEGKPFAHADRYENEIQGNTTDYYRSRLHNEEDATAHAQEQLDAYLAEQNKETE